MMMVSMTNRNIAIIVAGYWGTNLVRNFYQLVVLKTICDGWQSIRIQMSDTYPDENVTNDMDAVLNDEDIKDFPL
jgi:UDP-2-acetamido-3-amino-2,3-dideoxy-glucuronate N-acetyltransferase